MSEFSNVIKKYIQIFQPLIYIRGNDELRVKTELENTCTNLNIDFRFEDCISLAEETGSLGQGIREFYGIIKNKKMAVFISNGSQILREREMTALISKIAIENLQVSIIVMSDAVDIPTVLNPYTVTLNLPQQTTAEITALLAKNDFKGDFIAAEEFAKHIKGLSWFEVQQLVRRARNNEDINTLTDKLSQGICSNNEFLSFVNVLDNEELGGFSKLVEKLDTEKEIFHNVEDAVNNKIPIPKGVMLVGIPGCGKSLAAKITAKNFNIPLLKMEFGKIMNKYVGESEANLFFALRFAEEYAPCILWLDEFEKSIVSSSDGGSDGNISNRLLGIFLNWLQEKTAPVYVVATVNNIDKMPPELLRRGRFDEIYKVELPKPDVVQSIMEIQLKKYGIEYDNSGKSLKSKDMKHFCYGLGDAYSGADIEELVKRAKIKAYCDNKPISIKYFEAAKQEVQPVDMVMHEQIQKIKEVFNKYNFQPVD